MARSPTARVELSKKAYTETITALLALLALLKAAGAKAGFSIPDQDEETDEEESDEDDSEDEAEDDEESEDDESEDEDEDEEEPARKSKSKSKPKSKSKDEDEDEEDEEEDDEEEDDEEEDDEEEDDGADALTPANLKKVKAALQEVLDTAGRKDAVALLTKYKVEKVSDLDDSQASLFIGAAKKIVEGASKTKTKAKKK